MYRGVVCAKALASDRRKSEDRAEIFEREGEVVVVLSDGAGGMAGGAIASEAFVAAVGSALAERRFDPWDVDGWSAVLRSVDADLATRLAGETTAIVVVIGARGVAGVSAGDSEAWVVSAARCDVLTEAQDRKRLGSGHARPVPFHRGSLDGTLVVATDGLFKHARAEAIAATCASGTAAEMAQKLVALPKLRSGGYPDDVAVVVGARVS